MERNEWHCITEISSYAENKKRPVTSWKHYKTRRQNNDELEQQPFNDEKCSGIGVITGPNDLRIIDFDKVGDPGSIYQFLDIIGLDKEYPWLVRSGSGSFHIYVKCKDYPSGQKKDVYKHNAVDRSRFDHLELRWNQHTVAPPSLHESGNCYEFVNSEGCPENAPEEVSIFDIEEGIKYFCQPEVKEQSKTPNKRVTLQETRHFSDWPSFINNELNPSFPYLDFLSKEFPGGHIQKEEERGNEVRVGERGSDSGTLHVRIKEGTWYQHSTQIGGGCLQLMNLIRNGDASSPKGKEFIELTKEACILAGIEFPDKVSNGVSDKFPSGGNLKNSLNTLKNNELQDEKSKSFQVSMFPEVYRKIIMEIQEAYNIPLDYVGTGVLLSASTAIGNSLKLKVKTGWYEPAILYAALVGNSSIGKTPALKTTLKPIVDLDRESKRAYRYQMEQWQLDCENIQKGQPKPQQPTRKQYVVNDATLESINMIHETNPRSLLYLKDELTGWINSMNQYRKGADQEFWLSSWSNEGGNVNRATKEVLGVDNPYINVIGGIQPSKVQELAKDNRDSDGFMFRILFAFPEDQTIPNWSDKEVSEESLKLYSGLIESIFTLNRNFNERFQYLEFNEEAKMVYVDYNNQNVTLMNTHRSDIYQSLLGKINSYCRRLALILEVLKWSADPTHELRYVSAESVLGAIELSEYYKDSIIRIYDDLIPKQPIPANILKAAELRKKGYTMDKVAQIVGVSNKGTISKWEKKFPDLFQKESEK